jgi:hypothetical protein
VYFKIPAKRFKKLQEEQLAIHQQATAQAVANAQVTIESLIAEAAAARVKAMADIERIIVEHASPNDRLQA